MPLAEFKIFKEFPAGYIQRGYEEKKLYIYKVGSKKVDISYRLTAKLITTDCY